MSLKERNWILASGVALMGYACMQGPGFMQQQGAAPLTAFSPVGFERPQDEAIVVPTKIVDNAAVGLVEPNDSKSQVLFAADNSAIAGASVVFPPGTVAIATEITLKPGDSLANSGIVNELDLLENITSSAPAVSILSSVPLVPSQPFTISLPIPDAGSALRLVGEDPLANLVVIYRVQDLSANSEKGGYATRSSLIIENNFVKFQTRHFGTFQALITKTLLPDPTKEVFVEPISELKVPPRKTLVSNLWYVRGLAGAIFDGNLAINDNFQGWTYSAKPALVSDASKVIQTGIISAIKKEEE